MLAKAEVLWEGEPDGRKLVLQGHVPDGFLETTVLPLLFLLPHYPGVNSLTYYMFPAWCVIRLQAPK